MRKLFLEACLYIPGGVNSPVRSFGNVVDDPVFIKQAKGSRLTSSSGEEYVDFMCSWGAIIAGHANSTIQNAIIEAASHGVSFGAVTRQETTIAKTICSLMPAIEKVRFVSSGTEACMSAIRLARGFSGRKYIIKFTGCYHGHTDAMLVKAGSGALTFGVPNSAGVPEEITNLTFTLPYNDIDAVYKCIEKHGFDIAAVIIEPIAGNMGMVPAHAEFLAKLRQACSEYDIVLIFDEVMSGFRVALGGAQAHYNITPDIVCLGKVIGGGMPVGAFGGRKDIMDLLAPLGPVYQAGTLSGNPVAVAAGLAALQLVQEKGFYDRLNQKSQYFIGLLQEAARHYRVPFSTCALGGMMGIFFSKERPSTFTEVEQINERHFRVFFHTMLEHNVYLPPSLYEASFLSAAHTIDDLDFAIAAARKSFSAVSKG